LKAAVNGVRFFHRDHAGTPASHYSFFLICHANLLCENLLKYRAAHDDAQPGELKLIGYAIARMQIAVRAVGANAAQRRGCNTTVHYLGLHFGHQPRASAAKYPIVFLLAHHAPPFVPHV
jgi:hypothetical protein